MSKPARNLRRCKHCAHWWPRDLDHGECQCPLPVWAWGVAHKLTRLTAAECPVAVCPQFDQSPDWANLVKHRLIKRRHGPQLPSAGDLFDHVGLEDGDSHPQHKKPKRKGAKIGA